MLLLQCDLWMPRLGRRVGIRSIDALGLMHPIVVTPDNRLVAGERRLRACQSLGWNTVPAPQRRTAGMGRGADCELGARWRQAIRSSGKFAGCFAKQSIN